MGKIEKNNLKFELKFEKLEYATKIWKFSFLKFEMKIWKFSFLKFECLSVKQRNFPTLSLP
jgi:hypothetical protein